jgi:hypothetical protein
LKRTTQSEYGKKSEFHRVAAHAKKKKTEKEKADHQNRKEIFEEKLVFFLEKCFF